MALVGAAIMALLYNFEAELGPIFVSAPRKEVVILHSLSPANNHSASLYNRLKEIPTTDS